MRGASSLLPQYMCALCKSTGRYPENTKGGQRQDGDKGTAARDYGKGGKQGGDARKRKTLRTRRSSRGSYSKACSMRAGGHERDQAAKGGTLQGEWD